MTREELVDRTVIDNSGNIIGKCIDIENKEDDENVLLVLVKTKNKGERQVEIPMSTIQAVGKTIVLTVAIEALIDNFEILPFKDDIEEGPSHKQSGDSQSSEQEKWVLYRSIKTSK